jgi:hypothetical protein
LAEQGVECEAPVGSLRYIARQMLIRAGQETAAAREIGDRLDGKPAQAIIGDSEADPVQISTIRRIIVKSGDKDGGSVPAASGAG